jgi:hypothetical protein
MYKKQSISVIIILYYSKHLLENLLNNIREKIKELDEIIFVDNSNEDLSQFENSLIRIIRPPKNIGYGAGINLGVSMAKNEIILALNPDVHIEKFDMGCVNELIGQHVIISGMPVEWKSIRCFPSLTFDFLRLSLFNLSRSFKWIKSLPSQKKIQTLKKPLLVDWISGALILTTKTTFKKLKGFDKEYFLFYEEVDLCKRAEQKKIPRYVTPGIQFRLNQGTSSSSDVSSIKFISEINSAIRYHSKYSGKAKTRLIFFLFKQYSFFIFKLLSFTGLFLKRNKLKKKQLQYKFYYEAIKNQ